MADKFDKINNLTDLIQSVKAKSQKAKQWFRELIKTTQRAAIPARFGRSEIIGERNIDVVGRIKREHIGGMFLMRYDAKTKEQLPYWDAWPLVFPFAPAKGGFYGINIHYLNPTARMNLMMALIKGSQSYGSKELDEDFRLKLSYKVLSSFPPAIPCVKRYLMGHVVKRKMYRIAGNDWAYAAGLPMQLFKKESASYVWKQSASMY